MKKHTLRKPSLTILISFINIALLITTLVLTQKKDQAFVYSSDYDLLKSNGYNIVNANIEIANTGDIPGITSDTILLTLKNGRAYVTNPGDIDFSHPCVNKRSKIVNTLGGPVKAAQSGFSSVLEGCRR